MKSSSCCSTSTRASPASKSALRDKVEGTAMIVAGNIKQATGKLVGNDQLKARGQVEESAGRVQKKVGVVKAAVKSTVSQ